uniref:COesterase domain-containing protein n=1 Tax=Panagrellus redivivus TaxID=6233 RepID=A0A7E4V5L1_PANRE
MRVNPSGRWPDDQYHIAVAHPDCLLDSSIGNIQALKYSLTAAEQPFESCVALGIPYSQLPRHRFEFTHGLKYQGFINATKFGAKCVPIKTNINGLQNLTDENCLFINAFIPHKTAISTIKHNLPILMVIHGGGFSDGSAENFDTKGILRNYVNQDIIVVTVNYRLGSLGFFVNHAYEIKNAGLYDVLQAYLFVTSITEGLRGDPNRIAILGVDSGAVMAELLSLVSFPNDVRPAGIIAIGGSISMPWAMSPNVAEVSDDLVWAVGGASDGVSIRKADLMSTVCAPVDAILNGTEEVINAKRRPQDFIPFAPTFDAVMFNAPDLSTAMRDAEPIPHFYIASQYDGLLRTTEWTDHNFTAFSDGVAVEVKDKATFTCDQFHDYVDSLFRDDTLRDGVKKEYLCNVHLGYTAYEQLISDYFFMMPMISDAMFFAKHKHTTYLSVVNPIHLMLNKTYGTNYVPISVLAETLFFTIESPYHSIDLIDHFEYHYYIMHRHFTVNNIVEFTKHSKLGFDPFPKADDKNYTVIGSHFEQEPVYGNIATKFPHLSFWQKVTKVYGTSAFNSNLKALNDEFTDQPIGVPLPQ